MERMLAFGTVILALAVAAAATPPTPPQEAHIAFANHGGISDWQADGGEAMYLRSSNGKWYHAKLLGRCLDLDTALAVGFDTRPIGDFDKFSKIIVHGRPCPVTSLVLSDPPPHKAHKPSH
jgi:hypothetical protein